MRCTDRIEQPRKNNTHAEIDCECKERGITGYGEAARDERKDHRLEMRRRGHPGAGDNPCGPADDQGPGIEPAGVEARDYRRNDLTDPNAAEQLQLDRVLQRQQEDEEQSAELHDQRYDLCILSSASTRLGIPG
jgi:hypothetical protein